MGKGRVKPAVALPSGAGGRRPRRRSAEKTKPKPKPSSGTGGSGGGGGGGGDGAGWKGIKDDKKGKKGKKGDETSAHHTSLEEKKAADLKHTDRIEALKRKQKEAARLREMGIDATVNQATTRKHGYAGKLKDGHALGVYDADFTATGKQLASCSHDGAVVLWDVLERKIVRRYRGHKAPVYGVAFSPDPDSRLLATCGYDGVMRVFNTNTGVLMLSLPHDLPLQCCAWSTDGAKLASGAKNGTITVWDARGAEEQVEIHRRRGKHDTDMDVFRYTLFAPPPANPQGHRGTVRALAWRNPQVLLSASDDRSIRVWTVDKQKLVKIFSHHKGAVLGLDLTQDGATVLSCSQDGTARVCDFRTGTQRLVLRGHNGVVYSAKFRADGLRIITGGHDKAVCVYKTLDGTLLQRISGAHSSFIFGIAARPDALQFAAASGDHTISLWRALPLSSLDKCGGPVLIHRLKMYLKRLFRRKADVEESDAESVGM